MPAGAFSRELGLPGTAEGYWTTLTDVPTLVSWISVLHEGNEIEPMRRYSAVLMDRVGPFKVRADLDIFVSDVQYGSQARLAAQGEDRQVASRIGVDVMVRLVPGDPGTLLSVAGTYEVTGRIATLGAGTIRKKADKILDEFFGNLSRGLA